MVAVALAAALAVWVFARLPMRTVEELRAEEQLFATGSPLELVEVTVVRAPDIGPIRAFGVSVISREGDVERADLRGPFPVLTEDAIPSSAAASSGLVRAFRDPVTGIVATTLERDAVGARWLAISVISAVFFLPILALLLALFGRIREHLAVVRAARASDELLVDVAKAAGRTIDYRITSRIDAHAGGYRMSAAPRRWLARYRQRTDERPPLIVEGREQRRMVVLQTRGARAAVVVRADFWPFLLDAEARREAEERTRAVEKT